jgi:SAM-dependent methyltransferase
MGVSEASRTPAEVVWHELECGSYRADRALWREVAAEADGPILDVGAGTGRVTLELARAGHAVTALDSDPALLAALRERASASALTIETVQADARSFSLARADFALCIVPMQTIQLLGGGAGRMQFLRRARAHLRSGGVLACAILGALDPFDCSQSGIGPAAEQVKRDGLLYVSRAIRVSESDDAVVIERERRILSEHAEPPSWPFPREHERHDGERERNVIELDRVTVATLGHEGDEAGLTPLPTRELVPTDEHVGSSVVMFGA